MSRTIVAGAGLLLACLTLAGLSPAGAPAAHATAPSTASRPDRAGTVWLCRPGSADDPCAGDLAATAVEPDGTRIVQPATARGSSAFDCFYLYPTASTESTPNANLVVQPAEREIALAQAARFSRVCDVWAPMYRQVTVHGSNAGGHTSARAGQIAYASVVSAWKDFLAHDDHGRPIVFISHSQGSVMMIRLLSQYVDRSRPLRRRTVVAIIAGGNVAVPTGRIVGLTFTHLPLCTAADEVHCVIAYSSFPSEPPAFSDFGRPGQGIGLHAGQTSTSGVQIACVNPADIGGGTAAAAPYFPLVLPAPDASMAPPGATLTTPWVTYPGLYSEGCRQANGASWLQITDVASPGETRPVVNEPLGPSWGYHPYDINLSLGNLVDDVQAEEAAYRSAGHAGTDGAKPTAPNSASVSVPISP